MAEMSSLISIYGPMELEILLNQKHSGNFSETENWLEKNNFMGDLLEKIRKNVQAELYQYLIDQAELNM